MRNYQYKNNNPYVLPHNLYVGTLSVIRDYDRLKNDAEHILYSSPPPPDGQPKSSALHNSPTESKAIKLANIKSKIDAVEKALNDIPQFYRAGIINNIKNYSRYPVGASSRTFKRYKQKFVYMVAENLDWI